MRTIACTAVFFFVTLALANSPKLYAQADSITPAEARAIAKEAYIYGFPVVDNYRIMHSYFVDRDSGEFKADWNHIHNEARVYTPQDRAIQTPNSDTPYSQLGTNLLVEPLVITVPEVPKDRYYSLQFIDLYTFNYAYVGSRATMNEPGNYLLTGPIFASPYIDNIKKIIRCETRLGFVLFRTQLLDPNDIAGVEAVQAGYKVQTLSQFQGKKGPDPRPIEFIKPLTAQEQRTSLDFYKVLSFALSFCPPHPSEDALIARFAKLKIGPSGKFNPSDLSPEIKAAVEQGMTDAWQEFAEYKRTQIDTGKRTAADGFGTREYLKNDYMARMASAVLGIYGNSKEEALYPAYFVDAEGQKLSGTNKYTLHFGPNQLPPVNAFWSLTMYKLPQSLLVENPINRYLINSPMLPDLKRDADGGLTLYVQHDSPGKELQSNWLPAPEGDFFSVLRLYWPKEDALDGKWTAPKMQKVKSETPDTVAVTPDNFARAESDLYFAANVKRKPLGVFDHHRLPTAIDDQVVIRMNRDTLYSAAVVDLDAGPATITLPQAGDRFMSMQIINEDHFAPLVTYKSGKHVLSKDTMGARYVMAAIRILVDPNDEADLEAAHKLQDAITVEQASSGAFEIPQWDAASQKKVRDLLVSLGSTLPDTRRMFGKKIEVDPVRHLIGSAMAWGGNPDKDALYLNVTPKLNDGKTVHTLTVRDVPVNGFWSISIYNAAGFFEKNDQNIYTLNNLTAHRNADGSVTVQFGGYDGKTQNCLPITPGWNYMVRLYRPREAILDGSWKFPEATPIK